MDPLQKLAKGIKRGKRTVFLTGAGLSVASGIRPYRSSPNARWKSGTEKQCSKAAFRKNSEKWYEEFWIPNYNTPEFIEAKPNAGHLSLEQLRKKLFNVKIVTQNVDRLHAAAAVETKTEGKDEKSSSSSSSSSPNSSTSEAPRLVPRLIEAHGRLGDYRCVTSRCSYSNSKYFSTTLTPFSSAPIEVDEVDDEEKAIESGEDGDGEDSGSTKMSNSTGPTCPGCGKPAIPLVLMFDEQYKCHSEFRWAEAEKWFKAAEIIVFVATSHSVGLTNEVKKIIEQSPFAKEIYHFNLPPDTISSNGNCVDLSDCDFDCDKEDYDDPTTSTNPMSSSSSSSSTSSASLSAAVVKDFYTETDDRGEHHILGKCELSLPHLAELCLQT